MKRSRKPYPAEFKQEAVRLLKQQQLPRSQVALDLGIDAETLRRWVRELAPGSQVALDLGIDAETLRRWARELAPDTATPGDTSSAPPINAAELARLHRDNEHLRKERDILKKALGIFSRMPE
jgi:transposase